MLNSYLESNFDAIYDATGNRYVNGDDIRLGNLGPIALFSNYKLTTSPGKHLEEISHAHIVSVMYKFLTSSRGSDDSSIGFDRDRDRRRREVTNFKNNKENIMLEFICKMCLVLAKIKKKLLMA